MWPGDTRTHHFLFALASSLFCKFSCWHALWPLTARSFDVQTFKAKAICVHRRERERERESERARERERERERQKERKREREKERKRESERESENSRYYASLLAAQPSRKGRSPLQDSLKTLRGPAGARARAGERASLLCWQRERVRERERERTAEPLIHTLGAGSGCFVWLKEIAVRKPFSFSWACSIAGEGNHWVRAVCCRLGVHAELCHDHTSSKFKQHLQHEP